MQRQWTKDFKKFFFIRKNEQRGSFTILKNIFLRWMFLVFIFCFWRILEWHFSLFVFLLILWKMLFIFHYNSSFKTKILGKIPNYKNTNTFIDFGEFQKLCFCFMNNTIYFFSKKRKNFCFFLFGFYKSKKLFSILKNF